MNPDTLYISFDLETLGGNPEDLPVINWGFVAYLNRKKVGQLSINTRPLRPDQDTVAWFHSTPELRKAYDECTREPVVGPKEGMEQIRYWINSMTLASPGSRLLFVAYPTVFDGSMLYYYWFRYLGHPTNGRGPGFTIVDIRSFAAGHLGISYFDASVEKALKPYVPNTEQEQQQQQQLKHTGLWDAERQMGLFFNVMDAKRV